MSLWDDYKADFEFTRMYPHGVNNDEWRTRDGKILKVKDMTTEHIKNCMRMIGETDDFYYVFEAELKQRGTTVDGKCEPVKHGRWIHTAVGTRLVVKGIFRTSWKQKCSICGYMQNYTTEECPHCHAKMDRW